jgi:hypothetical protein
VGALLVQRSSGVGGLVGVDADHYRHAGAFLEGLPRIPGGQADLGLGRPLLSHSRSGADRTAQPFLSQPEGGSGGSGATCRHPGTYGLQTQGSYRSFNKSVASDFLDEAVRCAVVTSRRVHHRIRERLR